MIEKYIYGAHVSHFPKCVNMHARCSFKSSANVCVWCKLNGDFLDADINISIENGSTN